MAYLGTYSGVVKENRDPQKLGRLKVYVPIVYGVGGEESEAISVDDTPWALPAGLPAGGSAQSGGFDWLPSVGDQVWVRFLDGEPEKPVWEWGSQTLDQAKKLQLYDYDKATKAPKRGGLTRYGHTLDFTPGGLVLTTKNGYSVNISDSDLRLGSIVIKTPTDNTISIDDLQQEVNVQTRAGQMLNISDLTSSILVDANLDMDLQAGLELNAQAGNVKVEALSPTGIVLKAGNSTITITSTLTSVELGSASILMTSSSITLALGQKMLIISNAGFNFSG